MVIAGQLGKTIVYLVSSKAQKLMTHFLIIKYSDSSIESLHLLTSQQALADAANFITIYSTENNLQVSCVSLLQ